MFWLPQNGKYFLKFIQGGHGVWGTSLPRHKPISTTDSLKKLFIYQKPQKSVRQKELFKTNCDKTIDAKM